MEIARYLRSILSDKPSEATIAVALIQAEIDPLVENAKKVLSVPLEFPSGRRTLYTDLKDNKREEFEQRIDR